MATSETVRSLGAQMAKWEQQNRQASVDAEMSQTAALNPATFQNPEEFAREQAARMTRERLGEAHANTEQARAEEQRINDQILTEMRLATEQAQTNKARTEGITAQNQSRNAEYAASLIQQMAAIDLSKHVGKTVQTLPTDILRDLSNLSQQWNALRAADPSLGLPEHSLSFLETGITPRVTQQEAVAPANREHPETFDNGRYSQFKQNEDGTVQVKVATGETFKAGNMEELLEKVSKSKVDTSRWAREQRATAQQQPEGQQYSSIADYWGAEQEQAAARAFGFKDKAEAMQFGEDFRQTKAQLDRANAQLEEISLRTAAADFLADHPEFPGTQVAEDAIGTMMQQYNMDYTAENIAVAHAACMQRGIYQPLTQEQIAYANGTPAQSARPVPPPMAPRGGNPELSSQEFDPWSKTLSLDQLRAAAIRQQLSGGQ